MNYIEGSWRTFPRNDGGGRQNLELSGCVDFTELDCSNNEPSLEREIFQGSCYAYDVEIKRHFVRNWSMYFLIVMGNSA